MPIERKIISIEKVRETKKKAKKEAEKPDYYYFFDEVLNKKGNLEQIVFKMSRLISLLKSFGFYRYDYDLQNSRIVKIDSKLVSDINRQLVIDHFETYIQKEYDFSHCQIVEQEDLLDKIYKSMKSYFSEDILNRLRMDEEIVVNRDKIDRAYFYYRNGFVEIYKEEIEEVKGKKKEKVKAVGYELKPYKELDNYIWKNQRIDRDFIHVNINPEKPGRKTVGVFGDYIYKVANQDKERFNALCSIIGYNLHDFHEYKLKATLLTDSSLSDDAEGRTGKTLFCKALGFIRKYAEINGKDFNPEKDFKYSEADVDTQIVHLNDVKSKFDIEWLFNDITEGILVNKKNDKPFKLRAKMIVSTNKTIRISGSSARDRVTEFEFSDYFSDRHSPEDEYKQWFFRDWDEKEWSLFDNFMCYCAGVFLQEGLVDPGTINLEERKLREETKKEFIEFMEDIIIPLERSGRKIHEEEFNKGDLFNKFKEQYPDFNNNHFTQRTFTAWLETFAKFRYGIKKCKTRRSGSERFIQFKDDKEE